jgi:hypothetical protein
VFISRKKKFFFESTRNSTVPVFIGRQRSWCKVTCKWSLIRFLHISHATNTKVEIFWLFLFKIIEFICQSTIQLAENGNHSFFNINLNSHEVLGTILHYFYSFFRKCFLISMWKF